MKKGRSMSKLGKWLAGIIGAAAATFIGSYAYWYFTRPPAVTTFDGLIYSVTGPVGSARVALDLTGRAGANGSSNFITDNTGRYRFDVPGMPKDTSATLSVFATKYEEGGPKAVATPLQADNRVDFPMTPVTPPVTSAAPGGLAAIPPKPMNPAIAKLGIYKPLTAAQAVRVQIMPKK